MKIITNCFFLLVFISSFSQKKGMKTTGNNTVTFEEIGFTRYVQYKEKVSKLMKKIKKSDTLYVYFKYGKNELKRMSGFVMPTHRGTEYIFKFNDGHEFIFLKDKYLNLGFDKEIADVKTKRKRFLRKNKGNILTIEILDNEKYLLASIYFMMRDRPIYLIDCKETHKRKITLRQITLFSDYGPIE